VLPLDEVFVRALVLADAPALGEGLARFVAAKNVVAVTGAGVVNPHPLAHRAAQAAIDRQPDALAEEVPQRDVDGGQPARFGADGAKRHALSEGVCVPRHLAWILAEQIGHGDLADVTGRGLGAKERLAQADQTLVRVDLNPEQVGVRGRLQRFDAGDLHGRYASTRSCGRTRLSGRTV